MAGGVLNAEQLQQVLQDQAMQQAAEQQAAVLSQLFNRLNRIAMALEVLAADRFGLLDGHSDPRDRETLRAHLAASVREHARLLREEQKQDAQATG